MTNIPQTRTCNRSLCFFFQPFVYVSHFQISVFQPRFIVMPQLWCVHFNSKGSKWAKIWQFFRVLNEAKIHLISKICLSMELKSIFDAPKSHLFALALTSNLKSNKLQFGKVGHVKSHLNLFSFTSSPLVGFKKTSKFAVANWAIFINLPANHLCLFLLNSSIWTEKKLILLADTKWWLRVYIHITSRICNWNVCMKRCPIKELDARVSINVACVLCAVCERWSFGVVRERAIKKNEKLNDNVINWIHVL